MLKAYKYRIYPNADQTVLLMKHFGCCRYIYNWGLERKNKAHAETGKSPTNYQLSKELPIIKKELEWLSEVNAQSLQQSLSCLDTAFTNFFRRVKQGNKEKGYPTFKSRHGRQSFQCPQAVQSDFENGTISIPKVKHIKTVFDRTFSGTIKTVTVSQEVTGKFFVSFLIDNGEPLPDKKPIDPDKSIGIDLGLTHFLTTSNGEKVDNPRFLKKDKKKITRLSRRLSKKAKGGKNRAKAKTRLALVHEKTRNRRKDFLHKLSTRLVRENQAICLEDLSVAGMMKNHKLARSIGDVAWNEFSTMLQYKAEWQGKYLLQIGRFDPSSKMCSSCGTINQGLTLKDRTWTCSSCKSEHDRDWNAAKNIRRMSLDKQNLIGKVPMDSRELTLGETSHEAGHGTKKHIPFRGL